VNIVLCCTDISERREFTVVQFENSSH